MNGRQASTDAAEVAKGNRQLASLCCGVVGAPVLAVPVFFVMISVFNRGGLEVVGRAITMGGLAAWLGAVWGAALGIRWLDGRARDSWAFWFFLLLPPWSAMPIAAVEWTGIEYFFGVGSWWPLLVFWDLVLLLLTGVLAHGLRTMGPQGD